MASKNPLKRETGMSRALIDPIGLSPATAALKTDLLCKFFRMQMAKHRLCHQARPPCVGGQAEF
jgi:hypothetical protein